MHSAIDSSSTSTTAASLDAVEQNEQNPAARPPPEVLLHIFSHLATIDIPQRRARSLGWLRVTHICQRWRRVALEDPSLWAGNILCPCPLGDRWADAFFSRSQAVPLTITKPPGSFSMTIATPREIQLFRNNIARMRVLHLSTYDNNIPILCQSAPLLDTLDLTLHYSPGIPHSRPPTLPDDLLGGATGAPALRHLRLDTAGPLPWTSPLFARLVSLNVVRRTNPPTSTATLAAILAALDRMPALERLVLQTEPRRAGAAPIRPVALPQLRSLALNTSVASGRHFLAHVVLPANARVQCNLECRGTADEDLAALFRAAAECRGTSAAPISLRVSTDMIIWRSGPAGVPAIALALQKHTRLAGCVVASALAALVSEHLELIEVCSVSADTEWPAHLRRARALRRVEVARSAVPQFCTALVRGPASFLPALSELVILDGASLLVGHEDADGTLCTLESALVACLLRRARAGSVLRMLEVADSRMNEECLRVLREAGIEVRLRQIVR
ncbi:hypothetical protein FA95DRAFT_1402506 [Auriscalpium vulgare]|uniref:Uncharacterized protein n=1 Tax=Auriscalpium vulgare TaxID=40419 RepID=A0ACB8RQJ6_9AGAM|nr:hypothetical protein FA95DRAFT_1402506 [Auriscalpium vulgare]